MSDTTDPLSPDLVVKLWRACSACRMLATLVEIVAEEPDENGRVQMDRLYGVAYLIDLVGESVGDVHLKLMEENPAVGG